MASLTANDNEITPNGYRLSVGCACDVEFQRWITPQEALVDLALMARWN